MAIKKTKENIRKTLKEIRDTKKLSPEGKENMERKIAENAQKKIDFDSIDQITSMAMKAMQKELSKAPQQQRGRRTQMKQWR